jgi:signal transduction histidine kinase
MCDATDHECAALLQARLTEANAALQRSLDVLASEADVDRLLAHILAETGARLSAQRIVLWLAEGKQAATIAPRLCWADGRATSSSVDVLLGTQAAAALMNATSQFRQLRLPLLRPTRDCVHLSDNEARSLEEAGVRALFHVPLLMGQCFLGAIVVLFDTEPSIPAEDLKLVEALALQATLAIRLSQLSLESQHAAITRERARMSREIHDTTLQTFIGIIRHLKGRAGRAPDVSMALSLAESGIAEARRAVTYMRPSLLEGRPLVDSLKEWVSRLPTEGLRVRVTSSGTPMNLMPESEGNLFRIVQEAVNNVVNPANATEVAVDISFLPGELTVLISDNGRGFDVASVDSERGFGLFSMKQRAQAIGAELMVVSEPLKGTQVYLSWRATSSP